MDEKHKFLGNFEKFSEGNCKKSISFIFFKRINKSMSFFFRRLDEKHIVGKFRKFSKNLLWKLQKIHYFSIFFKKINKHMRSFFAVWTKYTLLGNFEKFLKIFDKKFDRKIVFLTICGKVVAKNRAFGNNIIFLQQFFPFRGGGFPPFPPGYATGFVMTELNGRMAPRHKLNFFFYKGFRIR